MLKQKVLINIIGIDGSGKTTLAKKLTTKLNAEKRSVKYIYCQHSALLLYPLRIIARFVFLRKSNQFKDYSSYDKLKKWNASKYGLLLDIYLFVWMVDYIIQLFVKVALPWIFSKKSIIVDRYVWDTSINIALLIGGGVDYACRFASAFFKFCPKPTIVLFLDLDEKIAFTRKNDVPSIKYLKERGKMYHAVSNRCQFALIDGSGSKKDVVNKVIKELEARDI